MQELQFKEPIIAIQFIKENFDLIELILNERLIKYSLYKSKKQLLIRYTHNIEEAPSPKEDKLIKNKYIVCEYNMYIVIFPFRDCNLHNVKLCNEELLEYYFNPIRNLRYEKNQ